MWSDMGETAMPNEPNPWVYWDVNVVGYTPDERTDEVLVGRFEYVTVSLDSDAKRVSIRDLNDAEVAVFLGVEDEHTHATVDPQGVEIMNLVTEEDRSVYLHLRPHLVHDAEADRSERFP